MPLPGPLRSPRNLIAIGLGFFLAIIFWMLSSSGSSRDSETKQPEPKFEPYATNELDRVSDAVRVARAWHVTSTGRVGNKIFQTEEDVVCPSDSHIVTRPLTQTGPSEVSDEFISIANTMYAHEAGESWHSQPDPDPAKCTNGPSAGSEKLLTLLDPIQHAARVTEGSLIKLNDGTCRIWELSGASNLPFHSICVDGATHYPRRLQIGGLLIEYSHWNEPALIAPPEMPSSHPLP